MKIRSGWILFLLVAPLFLVGCDIFSTDPCDKVYFDGDEFVLPNCEAYSLSNPQLDENQKLVYFEFRAVCSNAEYSGSVTLIRDGAGNVISKKVVVNGKTCD